MKVDIGQQVGYPFGYPKGGEDTRNPFLYWIFRALNDGFEPRLSLEGENPQSFRL